jgi:hypothetical protein
VIQLAPSLEMAKYSLLSAVGRIWKFFQDPFVSMDHVNGLLMQDILTFAFTIHDRPVRSDCK